MSHGVCPFPSNDPRTVSRCLRLMWDMGAEIVVCHPDDYGVALESAPDGMRVIKSDIVQPRRPRYYTADDAPES